MKTVHDVHLSSLEVWCLLSLTRLFFGDLSLLASIDSPLHALLLTQSPCINLGVPQSLKEVIALKGGIA